MNIDRDAAFAIFEALMAAGYHPRLSGMRVTTYSNNQTESFACTVCVPSATAGVTSASMAYFDALAARYGVEAAFSTYSSDCGEYDEIPTYGAAVSFVVIGTVVTSFG